MSTLDDGDSAWMFTSTVLTLLMTPALAFFYGGLVDKKNVLNTLSLSFICIGVISIQWFLVGYSFVFQTGNSVFGTFESAALYNWSPGPSEFAPNIPNFAHAAFQCAFAIVTPALMSGAVVGRIKFSTYVVFILLWSTLVYDAVAHWVWSPNGWLKTLGMVDFAGGVVVHMSSGVSALVATWFVGKRAAIGRKTQKHLSFTLLGVGLLWVGWHGFNAGSALAAGFPASLALFNTNLAASGGMVTWLGMDAIFLASSSPKISSAAFGFVCGLVGITPACGYVHPGWGLICGIITCVCCWVFCSVSRKWHWLDDTLDVFACHGVGGATGTLLVGLFAQSQFDSTVGSFYGNSKQFGLQLLGVVVVACYASVVTAIIFLFLKYTLGLRVTEAQETIGLDAALHHEVEKSEHLTAVAATANGPIRSHTLGQLVNPPVSMVEANSIAMDDIALEQTQI